MMYSNRDHWSFAQNASLLMEALGDSNKSLQSKQRRILRQLLLGPEGEEDPERSSIIFEKLSDGRMHFNGNPLRVRSIMLSLERAGLEHLIRQKFKRKAIRYSWNKLARGKR